MSTPKLELHGLRKEFGRGAAAIAGVDLSVDEGQMVALLGPSGCGKTTTLRMVAGLAAPTDGTIVVDGKVLSSTGNVVPPERRGMGMVFQSYALWPHMTVFDNVGYGLRLKKWSKDAIRERVTAMLTMVTMAQYANRYATELSGGQQQRVALARAIATEPAVLLLDEPLSNLDALLRESMRFEIRDLQQRLGITGLYVTHSQEEALALADRIAVMNAGRIVQLGQPEEIYHRPRDRFVATFIGLANVWPCTALGPEQGWISVRLDGVPTAILTADWSRSWQLTPGAVGEVAVRPENIRIATDSVSSSGNVLAGKVARVSFTGNLVDYFVEVPGLAQPIRVQSTPPVSARPGDDVRLTIDPEHCIPLEPQDSG